MILSLSLGMNSGTTLLTIKVLSYNLYMLLKQLLSKYNGDLYGKRLDIMEPFLGMQFGLMEIIEYLNISELPILMILKYFSIFLNLLVMKTLEHLSKRKPF